MFHEIPPDYHLEWYATNYETGEIIAKDETLALLAEAVKGIGVVFHRGDSREYINPKLSTEVPVADAGE